MIDFDNYKPTIKDLKQIIQNIEDDGCIGENDFIDTHEMEYQISEYVKNKNQNM